MLDYNNMHWTALKALCIQKGLDVSQAKGKEAYIKLLQGNQMEPVKAEIPAIITSATLEDLKSVGISEEGLKIDRLRYELDAMRVPMKVPMRGIKEMKFGNRVTYSINYEDKTIHFLGGCLGPICTTLQQPEATILKVARHYLGTFTWDAGKAKHVAGMGHQDDERNSYLDDM